MTFIPDWFLVKFQCVMPVKKFDKTFYILHCSANSPARGKKINFSAKSCAYSKTLTIESIAFLSISIQNFSRGQF